MQAEFISNSVGVLGGRLIAPSAENNYTIVRWKRNDGHPHSEAAIHALLDWLCADAGDQAAVATRDFFFDRLDLPNVYQSLPHTFVPALENVRKLFVLALTSGQANREQAIEYIEADNEDGLGA